MFMQRQTDGIFIVVFYFSQRTTAAEAKYHSFELECLAVIYAIKRFHIYLAGIKFKIITDCDCFRLTSSKRDINPHIWRWAFYFLKAIITRFSIGREREWSMLMPLVGATRL